MADVLVGSERRVLFGSYGGGGLPAPPPPPPPPESLLGRLDQIDLRLRQLEEQRRPADGEAPARRASHQHTKSLPSELQHVQLRGTLMDRLNLLESRIRQLSSELDLDTAAAGKLQPGRSSYSGPLLGQLGAAAVAGSSSSAPPPAEELRAWSETAPMLEPWRDPGAAAGEQAVDGSWSAVEILQRGARQLHRKNKPDRPANKLPSKKFARQGVTPEVKSLKEAKCACQKEKRKAERPRTKRRWFMVGC